MKTRYYSLLKYFYEIVRLKENWCRVAWSQTYYCWLVITGRQSGDYYYPRKSDAFMLKKKIIVIKKPKKKKKNLSLVFIYILWFYCYATWRRVSTIPEKRIHTTNINNKPKYYFFRQLLGTAIQCISAATFHLFQRLMRWRSRSK